MYRKVLFRGDKPLQRRELIEIQEPLVLPDQSIGLKKGGYISLSPTHIYIDPALISIPTNRGVINFTLDKQKIDLEQGKYFLTLNTEIQEGGRNPLTGGPFIGSLGSDVLCHYLSVTKDDGDISIFSFFNKLKIERFFYISKDRRTDKVIHGFGIEDRTDHYLISPGQAIINNDDYIIDKPISIEKGMDYLIYLSNGSKGPIDTKEIEIESFTPITTSEGNLVKVGSSTLVKSNNTYFDERFLLYSIRDGVIKREFQLQNENNLDALLKEVLDQRKYITDLSMGSISSRTSLNLSFTESDRNHPSFLASVSNYVEPYRNNLIARALGNEVLTSPFSVSVYSSSGFAISDLEITPTYLEPRISITPNFIPAIGESLPDSLSISLEGKYLTPLKNYYIAIGLIPNYSSPIRTDIGGYLSIDIDLTRDQIRLPLSISIWDEEKKVTGLYLTKDRLLDYTSVPVNSIGQRFVLSKDIYLSSISLGIEVKQLPNVELLQLYITDEAGIVISHTHNSSQSLSLTFKKPVRLDKDRIYYFFISTTIQDVRLRTSNNNTSSDSYLVRKEASSIKEERSISLHYSLLQANPIDDEFLIEIEKEPELDLDTNFSITEREEARFLSTPALSLSHIDLSNSFYLDSSYRYPSTWVSKHYNLSRPYKFVEVEIECSSVDIEAYVSPNHRDWDRLEFVSIEEYQDIYKIKYQYSYPDFFYQIDKGSVPRENVSILIDINSYLLIKRVLLWVTSKR